MADIGHVELAGSPAAMGEAFGEQCRDGARDLTQSRMDHLAEFVLRQDPGRDLSREDILDAARRTVQAHQAHAPAIWAEFAGIARAANLTVEELLIGNGYTDFRDFVLLDGKATEAGAAHDGECSAFLAPGECVDGQPVVGQTWDMNADAGEFCVFVHRKPDDAPETLGLTTTGCLCLMGMNSEGVSVGNTNLIPTDVRVGVNYLFTITRALEQSSAEAAIDAIDATPRLSGHNYYAADGRTAINLETTGRRSVRTVVEGKPFVHTNHYLAAPLIPLELRSQDLSNSRWRHERLCADFEERRSGWTIEECRMQLADVTQAKCNAALGRDGGGSASLATVVQCPGARTLYVCAGGAEPGNAEVLTL